MTLINRQLPSLWNGVSQQPAPVRDSGQFETNINCLPSVVDGLRKRPPTDHVARITTDNITSAHLHLINRDVTERYEVVITNGDLKVYDLAGNAKTVTFPSGKAYLNAASPRDAFRCVSVADYTFIVNRNVTVAMSAVLADQAIPPTNLVWLNRAYLGAAVGGAQYRQYTANPSGNTYRGVLQSFDKLPTTPSEGDVYQIQGNSDSNFTTYYVRYTSGVWNESVGLGIKNRITATTMPWALVRNADGTFTFNPFSWADRKVGDESTNPNPSFVGRAIRDVFFYKDRLGFAVDEGAVWSRVGDFGNFYRLTVLQLLEDETIDISASETEVTQIYHAVPFNTGMMLFSDQVQFRVTEGQNDFGPTSAGIKVATQYTMKTAVRPEPIGAEVYFVVENGGWAQVREYYVADGSTSSDAADVTAHVPKFIPAGVSQLFGSSTHNALFAITDGAPNRLYGYHFYWTESNTKAQSAWGYWEFDSDAAILSGNVIDNAAYLLIKRADGTHLEKIQLELGAVAAGLPYQIFLDRRASVTGTYLSGTNQTEYVLPYPVEASVKPTFRLVRGAGFGTMAGALFALDPSGYTWVFDNVVRITGNLSAASCFVGKKYEQRFRFSQQFMKSYRDRTSITTGRMQLRTWTVYFTNTAYFRTEVAPYGTEAVLEDYVPSEVANFDAKTLGQSSLILGSPVLATGTYTFGVQGDSKVAKVDIVNDTPYASTFTQAEFEGFYFNRAQTI